MVQFCISCPFLKRIRGCGITTMRPWGGDGSWHWEATHFCHTPYAWEHVYDAAYRALAIAALAVLIS
jgi:hypothetical protein